LAVEDGPSAGTRLLRLAIFAFLWLFALFEAGTAAAARPLLPDAHVYWGAWHGPLYAGGFVYPPAGALLFLPAAVLPYPAFEALWLLVLVASALWLLWPLTPALRIPSLVVVGISLAWGNAATLLAVGLALTPRYPALWALLAWTKVTPLVATVALLRQRNWRSLAIALGFTALVGALMLAVAPGLVVDWIGQLQSHRGVPQFLLPELNAPLALRVLVAVLIAWFGASRPWTLALAAAVATPDLTFATLGLLAAAPRLGVGPRGHAALDLRVTAGW
jgi:hypothetical protein